MEGFKQQKKIACFKEGGQVGYKSRKEHAETKEMAEDIKQDKAIVKKGVAQHEAKLHKGEPKTELKLKTGGRAKKEKGTVKKYCGGSKVKKYAEGGAISNAPAPKPDPLSDAAIAEVGKKRGYIRKAEGGVIESVKGVGKRLYENVMGTPEQNAAAQARLDKYEASKKVAPMPQAKGKTTGDEAAFNTSKVQNADDVGSGLTAKKRGGKC